MEAEIIAPHLTSFCRKSRCVFTRAVYSALVGNEVHVAAHHFRDHLLERRGGLPTECEPRLRRVTEEKVDFCGPEIPRIHFHPDEARRRVAALLALSMALPGEGYANFAEGAGDELADGMLLARGYYVVVGLLLLQH